MLWNWIVCLPESVSPFKSCFPIVLVCRSTATFIQQKLVASQYSVRRTCCTQWESYEMRIERKRALASSIIVPIQCLLPLTKNLTRVHAGCMLVWWQLWNFSWNQMKFYTFLHPNEPPQTIFWYLVTQFDCEPSKIGHIFTK